ncbi:MAG: hypothetical protein QM675_05755 [Protaetiibacter sp.]
MTASAQPTAELVPVRESRRSGHRGHRTRLDAFPRDPLRRWAMRLAFAAPYFIISQLAFGSGAVSALNTPNEQLLAKVAGIGWDRADPEWIGQIFPPISTVLAIVIPGGRFGLAVAGALIAGIFLQKLVEIMVQRRFPARTVVILTVALAANPLFAYTVTENFAAFLGLAFFGLAIADIVRFVAWRNTLSGFRAGTLLMLATFSDLSGLVYVMTSALAAPFLRLGRAGEKGARGANVLVIVYPTVSALGAILFLGWLFTGDPLASFGHGLLDDAPTRWARLSKVLMSVNGLFLVLPVLSAWLVALIVRRAGSIVVSTLVFVAILVAFVLGLLPSGSAGNAFILMTVMAIALVPTARGPRTTVLVDIVAIAQIVIAWGGALTRDTIVTWMTAVSAAFGGWPF